MSYAVVILTISIRTLCNLKTGLGEIGEHPSYSLLSYKDFCRSSKASKRLVRCWRATSCQGCPVSADSNAHSRLRLASGLTRLVCTKASTVPNTLSWATDVIPARSSICADLGPRLFSDVMSFIASTDEFQCLCNTTLFRIYQFAFADAHARARRCGQPGQQQGRRFPLLRSVRTLAIRLRLVSGFLASSTQQIHSLRARGVSPSHSSSTATSATRVVRKSSGTLCTTPVAISFFGAIFFINPAGCACKSTAIF